MIYDKSNKLKQSEKVELIEDLYSIIDNEIIELIQSPKNIICL